MENIQSYHIYEKIQGKNTIFAPSFLLRTAFVEHSLFYNRVATFNFEGRLVFLLSHLS